MNSPSKKAEIAAKNRASVRSFSVKSSDLKSLSMKPDTQKGAGFGAS